MENKEKREEQASEASEMIQARSEAASESAKDLMNQDVKDLNKKLKALAAQVDQIKAAAKPHAATPAAAAPQPAAKPTASSSHTPSKKPAAKAAAKPTAPLKPEVVKRRAAVKVAIESEDEEVEDDEEEDEEEEELVASMAQVAPEEYADSDNDFDGYVDEKVVVQAKKKAGRPRKVSFDASK